MAKMTSVWTTVRHFVSKIGVATWLVLGAIIVVVSAFAIVTHVDEKAEAEKAKSSVSVHKDPAKSNSQFKNMLELSAKKAEIIDASAVIDFKVKKGTSITIRDLAGKVKDVKFTANEDGVYRVNFVHAGHYRVYADNNGTRKIFGIDIIDKRATSSRASSSSVASSTDISSTDISSTESDSAAATVSDDVNYGVTSVPDGTAPSYVGDNTLGNDGNHGSDVGVNTPPTWNDPGNSDLPGTVDTGTGESESNTETPGTGDTGSGSETPSTGDEGSSGAEITPY